MYYNRSSYTGTSKKRIVIRIIIIAAALLTVAAATLAFGNYLKAKAAATAVEGTGEGRNSAQTGTGRDSPSGEVTQAKGVRSACVPLASIPSEDAAGKYVDALATKGCTGVTVVLVDRDGYLTYTSAAVAKFTHQKLAEVKDPAVISAIISAAKSHSMQTSGVIFSSADFFEVGVSAGIDATVASDAAALGFDEIVTVLPLDVGSLDSILAASAVKYINAIGENKGGAALGVALPAGVFTTPKLSPQVELFASVSDFLAIDLTDDPKTAVADALEKAGGYFALYELRSVLAGGDAKTAEASVKTLAESGLANYMFVGATDADITDDTEDSGSAPGGYEPTTPVTPVTPTTPDEPTPDEPAPTPDEPDADTDPDTEAPDEPTEPEGPRDGEPDATDAPDAPQDTEAAPDGPAPEEPPAEPDVPDDAGSPDDAGE